MVLYSVWFWCWPLLWSGFGFNLVLIMVVFIVLVFAILLANFLFCSFLVLLFVLIMSETFLCVWSDFFCIFFALFFILVYVCSWSLVCSLYCPGLDYCLGHSLGLCVGPGLLIVFDLGVGHGLIMVLVWSWY